MLTQVRQIVRSVLLAGLYAILKQTIGFGKHKDKKHRGTKSKPDA